MTDSARGGPPVVVASIAAVVREGHVLLVRRANPPDAGYWGFPGGKIESGETIEHAAARELLEETGLVGEAWRVFNAVDAFDHDEAGSLLHHFVLVAVLCRWIDGDARAGDDAVEVRWFPVGDLDETKLALSRDVAKIAHEAVALVTGEDG